VDRETVKIQSAVGHVLEAQLDLLARIWREVDLLLDPGGSPASTRGVGVPVAEVGAVRVVVGRSWRGQRRPARASVGRDSDVRVVVVLLDLVPGPERKCRTCGAAQVD